MNNQNKFIRKLYREKDIKEIDKKILSLGNDAKIDTETFLNLRIITTILVFVLSIIYKVRE